MFAIMQLALLYVAKQVVSYASFSAARAALVAESSKEAYNRATLASALICSPITGATVVGSNFSTSELQSPANMIPVPGWGLVPKSGISRRLKTVVSRLDYPEPGEVEVTVTHYYELIFPAVNYAFSWLAGGLAGPYQGDATGPEGTDAFGEERSFEQAVGIWNIPTPHIRLRETTRLAMPGG
jgi:hypothetical protein